MGSDLWTSRALCNSNIPGIPDPGNSQDFPGIPGNSREYRPPIPVPKVGNGIFHSHSRSRKLEWNFLLGFPFPKNGNGIFHFPFPFPKSKSHSRSWLEERALTLPKILKIFLRKTIQKAI